jgi:hypothetical protein
VLKEAPVRPELREPHLLVQAWPPEPGLLERVLFAPRGSPNRRQTQAEKRILPCSFSKLFPPRNICLTRNKVPVYGRGRKLKKIESPYHEDDY